MPLTWDLINEYKLLVEEGKVDPLACPRGHEVVTRIGLADEVYFQCFTCQSKIYPGELQVRAMRAALRSHRRSSKRPDKSS